MNFLDQVTVQLTMDLFGQLVRAVVNVVSPPVAVLGVEAAP